MIGEPASPSGVTRARFHTVLIANRGEIALRIIRTARQMGFGTVAVYSTADANARHVRAADRAVLIGEPAPVQSYLRIDRIIEAAKASGADAIHPGYGFLAENAELADACAEAGLVFIGPSADAIRKMGDKAAAKAVMMAAGVPCVPGYDGADQSEAALADEAAGIGYPVMIKARAGGGGRGMRLVTDAETFPAMLLSAKSEAKNAFGDDRIMLEKAIIRPRHIEIQIFGDRHGNAIHLGERDCSVQRRHQKLIEEAPSPAVSPELRARMGAAAVEAVRAIGYEGAGTLEFLLAPDGAFYFIEMNTRLQVEHPVTEAVTGLDLVALQLRIALGEPIGIAQDEVAMTGHSIEVRVCAEDPAHAFAPQSGRMALWRMPEHLRVEDALEDGASVPPYYDSMIAKLISHGETRDAARRQLLRGLHECVALGVETNIAFLARCLDHPTFANGEARTDFIHANLDDLLPKTASRDHATWAVAAMLLSVTERPPIRQGWGRSLAHDFPTPMRFMLGGELVAVALLRNPDGGFAVSGDGWSETLFIEQLSNEDCRFRHQGVLERAIYIRESARLMLKWGRDSFALEDLTRVAEISGTSPEADGLVRAVMAGQVVAVHVEQGAAVQPRAALVTIEAMKMEHVHSLATGGTVAEVLVRKGDQVTARQVLARIAI